jgi:hypothetical protein
MYRPYSPNQMYLLPSSLEARTSLKKGIQERFSRNELLDEEEDRRFRFDKRRDKHPDDLVICEKRPARMKEATAVLEAEARAEEKASRSHDAG